MYVYLLKQYSTGLCKIGKTKNIDKRIKQFKTGNSENIFLLNYFKSEKYYSKIESTLHNLYNIQRVENEWFDLDKKQISDFIDKCKIIENNLLYLENNNNHINI